MGTGPRAYREIGPKWEWGVLFAVRSGAAGPRGLLDHQGAVLVHWRTGAQGEPLFCETRTLIYQIHALIYEKAYLRCTESFAERCRFSSACRVGRGCVGESAMRSAVAVATAYNGAVLQQHTMEPCCNSLQWSRVATAYNGAVLASRNMVRRAYCGACAG